MPLYVTRLCREANGIMEESVSTTATARKALAVINEARADGWHVTAIALDHRPIDGATLEADAEEEAS